MTPQQHFKNHLFLHQALGLAVLFAFLGNLAQAQIPTSNGEHLKTNNPHTLNKIVLDHLKTTI